jgi:hypothetical protein
LNSILVAWNGFNVVQLSDLEAAARCRRERGPRQHKSLMEPVIPKIS